MRRRWPGSWGWNPDVRWLAWGLVGWLSACTPKQPGGASVLQEAEAQDGGMASCARYGAPEPVGQVPLELAELSGLAASTRHPGRLWAHNDSGNAFQLFALSPEGQVQATYSLSGVPPELLREMDLEDIALGPCAPGGEAQCLYLADTGDNFRRRKQVRLYRLPEPDGPSSEPLPVEVLPFTYPDGPHDVESLIVEPRSGRLAVITKTGKSLGEVFVLEGLAPGSVGLARRLGVLRAPEGGDHTTTAAALHPSGDRLLLRTYTRVWELRLPRATRLEELLARGSLVEVPGPSQAQSEAVTFLPGGSSWLVGSEFAGQRLYQVRCR